MGAYLFFLSFSFKKDFILFYYELYYYLLLLPFAHGMAWHVRVNRKLFLVCGGYERFLVSGSQLGSRSFFLVLFFPDSRTVFDI